MPSFWILDHQGKGRAYTSALEERGHRRIDEYYWTADFALFDHDVGPNGFGHRPTLDVYHQMGKPIFMYPHAARPMIQWDMYPVWPHTKVCFVHNEGCKEVMRRYGYPLPVEVVGWPYCEIQPFTQGVKNPYYIPSVLFGPIHAHQNGYMWPQGAQRNQQVYLALIALVKAKQIRLTVRHIRSLSESGLAKYRGVKYVQGATDGSTKEIDAADCVVSHQTFAYLAVARGKPTVMYFDDVAISGNMDTNLVYAKHWDQYRDYLKYPFEFDDQPTPDGMLNLIQQAMAGSLEAADWKRRLIGAPFDGNRMVNVLESYLA